MEHLPPSHEQQKWSHGLNSLARTLARTLRPGGFIVWAAAWRKMDAISNRHVWTGFNSSHCRKVAQRRCCAIIIQSRHELLDLGRGNCRWSGTLTGSLGAYVPAIPWAAAPDFLLQKWSTGNSAKCFFLRSPHDYYRYTPKGVAALAKHAGLEACDLYPLTCRKTRSIFLSAWHLV